MINLRRILASFLMLFALIVGLAVVNMPQVQAYEQYLNGDTNYVIVYGHQGMSWYLDKSSVVVKESDQKANSFACNIVVVDVNGNITATKTYWYYEPCQRDNFNEAYCSNDGKSWNAFNVNDYAGSAQVVVNGFKTGWRAAFGSGWS
jgi:hypothetical protein